MRKTGENTNGGKREGAGRPEKPDDLVDSTALQTDDPIEFLRALMRDPKVDIKLRQDSAKRLLALDKAGRDTSGKKGQRARAAEQAVEGRFAPIAAPKLVAVK